MHDMPRDNHEAEMAKSELYRAAKYAMKLHEMIQAGDELEGWTQAKITKASDYLASVFHYLDYELKFRHGGDNQMDMMPMGGEPQEKMAFSLAEKLERAMRKDKHDAIISEAKKKNDGNLANNAKPYDKVTRGDVIAGRLGKDAMGGKKLKEADKGDMDHDGQNEPDSEEWKQNRDKAIKKAKGQKVKETSVYETRSEDDEEEKAFQRRQSKKELSKHTAQQVAPGVTRYTKRDLPGQDTADDADEKTRKRKAKKFAQEGVAEGDSGAKYKVKSVGKDSKGEYYISPSTDKKVYKSGVKVGDHVNPKSGEVKKKVGEASHQAKTTMKHVNASNASPKVKAAIKKASKDIKPGTAGYGDRAAALKAAGIERD